MEKFKAAISGIFLGLFLAWFIEFCLSGLVGQEQSQSQVSMLLSSLFLTPFKFLGENWEGVLAVSAVVIACSQAHSARVQNRQSVRPHLILLSHNQARDKIIVSVKNIGLGPAIFHEFKVQHNGKMYSGDSIWEIFGNYCSEVLKKESFCNIHVKGSGIAPNEESLIFEVCNVGDFEGAKLLIKINNDFDFYYKYASMYGEVFERHLSPSNKIVNAHI